MADIESFASLLRRSRTAIGLSQAGLAERASLSIRAVGELERGNRRHPHRATVDALANALGLSGERRAHLEAAARAGRAPVLPPSGEPTVAPTNSPDAPLDRPPTGPRVAEHHAADRPPPPSGIRLPVPLSALIGRQGEIAEVVGLLRRPAVRLVTLTGPGGVGKTRLALEAARALAADLPDGAVMVPLADLTGPEQVLPAIAQAVGVQAGGRLGLADALAACLHRRRLLLVLDTFEHVAAAAPGVAAVLERCPDVQILATSRTPLRIRGEHQYPISPLGLLGDLLPASLLPCADPPTLADVERCPAVALFVARTRERVPDFELTSANAATVAAICARLDGLPLAIELAAAHTAVLTPECLLERLEHRLPLLVGGPIDLPARQRTLHDTIAWTQSLLTPCERRLMRSLAVFRGGFTLELAEAVCAPRSSDEVGPVASRSHGPDGLGSPDVAPDPAGRVLEGIGALVEKSLLIRQRDPSGQPRFRMLGIVREVAMAELAASGELAPLQDRLLDAMAGLAETADLYGPWQPQWLDRLDAERDNIWAALAWTVERERPARGVDLLCALLPWFRRAPADEGYELTARLLDLLEADAAPNVRARASCLAGIFAWSLGDGVECRAGLDLSVAAWRADGDHRRLAFALAWRALTGQDESEQTARRAGEEAVALFRQMDDPSGLADALDCLALVLVNQGELSAAEPLILETIEIGRAVRHPRLLASGLRRRGLLALASADFEGARDWLNQSIRLYRTADEPLFMTRAQAVMAQVSLSLGEVERAAAELAEALALARRTGDRWGIAAALEGLAWVASRRGRPERAAQLFGAAAGLCDPSWFVVAAIHREIRQFEIEEVRATLGDAAFVVAWARGQALALEQAIDEALDECSERREVREPVIAGR